MAFETYITLGQHCLPHLARGVCKDNKTRELGKGFRNEDARHQWRAGKMSFEEILITHDVPAGLGAVPGLDLKNLRKKQERLLMGKLFDQLISPQHSRL